MHSRHIWNKNCFVPTVVTAALLPAVAEEVLDESVLQSRAIWVLAQIGEKGEQLVEKFLEDGKIVPVGPDPYSPGHLDYLSYSLLLHRKKIQKPRKSSTGYKI